MGRSKKFDYEAAIEDCLSAHPDGLALDELLQRSGLEVDRSTLFRHLTKLIEQGRAERIGKARASRYRPPSLVRSAADPVPVAGRQPGVAPAPAILEHPLPAATPVPPPSEVRQLPQAAQAEPDRVPALAVEHDEVVKKAVRKIVREWKRFDRVNLQIYLSLLVKPGLQDGVAVAVEKELAGLHQGKLAAFELTPAEFADFTPPGREAGDE